MTQKWFNNVREFIDHRNTCIFCKTPLIFRLTNYVLNFPIGKIPVLYSKIEEDLCTFKFAYTAPNINVKATGHLDVSTNILSFDMAADSNYEDRNANDFDMVEIFEQFKPYVELCCRNKTCKTNYYLASDVLSCIPHVSKRNHLKIPGFLLFYEACNLDKYWIQNDWITGATYIVSKSNPTGEPMKIAQLNFDDFDKAKLEKRICTLVTFS